MQVQPYLFFDGRCEEAIAFYRGTLGVEVTALMRFKEAPPQQGAPAVNGEKIMHASFKLGDTTVMLSDGECKGTPPGFTGFYLTLSVADVAEAQRVFAGLGEGGQVQMPLAETFFAPSFGMLTDRFGVPWMVIVAS